MNSKNLYVDFHVIQTVPPSCVNRDDIGRPKTAMYGGVNRARVSSQAWKRAIREKFKDIFTDEKLGFRTKYSVDIITDAIKELNPNLSDEEATKKANEALDNVKIKSNIKKGNTTDALFFISSVQAKQLARLSVDGEKDKNSYREALKNNPSIDIALFGRMVASDQYLNIDATSQVAHSISTHAVQNEYDYFTALDDKKTDTAGAGHLGTMEFNSSTLYRYATVNVSKLHELIADDTADAIKGFAKAFISSMPTGKQNSYANGTLPNIVYVTINDSQPVNLVGAFEKPIFSNSGYVEKSISTLFEYAKNVYENYCNPPIKSFVIGGSDLISGAETVNINQLLDELKEYITNEVK